MNNNSIVEADTPQILVVDDTLANLKLLTEILVSYGYRVRPASSGYLALRTVAVEKPDLIMLDIKMPEMDGYEVCRRLKSDEQSCGIPIIFISALDDSADKVKGFTAGGVDYITKPFQAEEVLARIELHLSLSRLQKQLEARNIQLQQEIAERKHTESQLEQKNQELENAYAELKATQLRIIQQEKLAGIGQLAAGVAHEINNPLGFVKCNFESLTNYIAIISKLIQQYQTFKNMIKESQVGIGDMLENIEHFEKTKRINDRLADITDLLQESQDGLVRISKIVVGLRTFARSDNQDQITEIDLNKVIQNVLLLIHNEIKYHAKVNLEVEDKLLFQGAEGYINQVMLNLILNAAQAIKAKKMTELGVIEIKSWQSDERIYCSIKDNGIGIKRENCSRIFEPFFTTKPVGEGTGLGLSISYDIVVNKYHGELLVESHEGVGTVFTIMLPICRQTQTAADIVVGDGVR